MSGGDSTRSIGYGESAAPGEPARLAVVSQEGDARIVGIQWGLVRGGRFSWEVRIEVEQVSAGIATRHTFTGPEAYAVLRAIGVPVEDEAMPGVAVDQAALDAPPFRMRASVEVWR